MGGILVFSSLPLRNILSGYSTEVYAPILDLACWTSARRIGMRRFELLELAARTRLHRLDSWETVDSAHIKFWL